MKYYNLSRIEKYEPFDIGVIFGQKGNGKSFCIKERMIKNFIAGRGECVYLRRFSDEVRQHIVDAYFNDMPIKEWTGGEFDRVVAYQNRLYLANPEEDRKKWKMFGYYFSLDKEQKYAGIQLPKVTTVLFDEWFARDYFLHDECYRFMCFLSTLARDNKPKVWLVGNNATKLSPYIAEWGLERILSMPQGSFFRHKVETNTPGEFVEIVVERCPETSRKTNSLIMGRAAKNIAGGEWVTRQAPHLDRPEEEYHKAYTLVIEKEKMRFLVQLLTAKGEAFLYVTPKTSEPQKGTRLITDQITKQGELITYIPEPITPAESPVFYLMRAGKIRYSDNTTAHDFGTVLESYGFGKTW